MQRFVLRYQGAGATAAPPDQVEMIRRRLKVVDESRKMLLVEAADQASVDALLAELPPGWKGSREVEYRSPEPKVRTAPES